METLAYRDENGELHLLPSLGVQNSEGLPAGGEVGQVLTKTEEGAEWQDPTGSIPDDLYVLKEGTGIDESTVSIEGDSADLLNINNEGQAGDVLVKTDTGAKWQELDIDLDSKANWGTTLEDYNIQDAKITDQSIQLGDDELKTVIVTNVGTAGQHLVKTIDGNAEWKDNDNLNEIVNVLSDKADKGTTLEDYNIQDAKITDQSIQLGDDELKTVIVTNEGTAGQFLVMIGPNQAEWKDQVNLNEVFNALGDKVDKGTTLEDYNIQDAKITDQSIQLGDDTVDLLSISDDGVEGEYKFLMKTAEGAQWTTLDAVVNNIIKNYLSNPTVLVNLKDALEEA